VKLQTLSFIISGSKLADMIPEVITELMIDLMVDLCPIFHRNIFAIVDVDVFMFDIITNL
jgi:hypothetical protein